MLITLALFACSPGKVSLGEDVVGGEPVDVTDTATDTGSADDSGNGGGDTGGGGGQDTGGGGGQDTGNGGGGGGDTGVPPDPDAGDYSGSVDGSLEFGRDGADCEGETTFTVSGGVLSGDGTCVVREWGVEFAGALEATVSGGRVEGTWTVDVRGYPVPVTVTGTLARGTAELDLQADFGWGTFEGQIDARR
jgi:hypothetical protein